MRSEIFWALVCAGGSAASASLPFTRIVTFGDSYTDDGDAFGAWAISGGLIPGPGYYQGKVSSNGPVWATQLAELLDVEILGRAVAGSTVDNATFFNPSATIRLPGVVQEVAMYLANDTQRAQIGTSLHLFLCGGINELFINPATQPIDVANRLAVAVQSIVSAGGSMLLLGVEPSLSSLPNSYAPNLTQPVYDALDRYAADIKGNYSAVLRGLTPAPTAGIVDLRGLFAAVDRNGTTWGFNNYYLQPPIACASGLGFGSATPLQQCGDPQGAFYWDKVHPTTAGHAVIARSFLTTIFNVFGI